MAPEQWDAFVRVGMIKWEHAVRKQWPRYREKWTLAEDRRLLRLVREHSPPKGRNPFGPGKASTNALVAKELGRSTAAICTRLATLRVAKRGL